jgi:hypothetical protein
VNTEQMMNFLFSRRVIDLPHTALAEVFDSLIWCMDDNGEEITNTQKCWLECGDLDKVKIALSMTSVLPYKDLKEAEFEVAAIKKNHPDLDSLCELFLSRFR